jgi:hypothetical protein
MARVRWFISLDGNYPSEKGGEGAPRSLIAVAKRKWVLSADDGRVLRVIDSGYVGVRADAQAQTRRVA